MKEESILIPSSGLYLEGLLNYQEALSFKGGVIFCHPHPLYGGNMFNSVIHTAVEGASQEGLSTLRFNFRGVGESQGSYGEGIGEKEDVRAAIEYFYSKVKNPNIILLGYSFGAWVGLPIAIDDNRVNGMVAIAPPLELYDFGFLKGCRKRKYFVVGDRDLYCSIPLIEDLYQKLEEPKSLRIIDGADHFFSFHHPVLVQPLKEFFKTI